MKKQFIFSIILCISIIFLYNCANTDDKIALSSIEEEITEQELIFLASLSGDEQQFDDLYERINRSDYIIRGKIIKRAETELIGGHTLEDLRLQAEGNLVRDRSVATPSSGIVTPFKVEIREVYKGDVKPGETIRLIQFYGNYHGYGKVMEGSAVFNEGEEYILFLGILQPEGYIYSISDRQLSIPITYNIKAERELQVKIDAVYEEFFAAIDSVAYNRSLTEEMKDSMISDIFYKYSNNEILKIRQIRNENIYNAQLNLNREPVENILSITGFDLLFGDCDSIEDVINKIKRYIYSLNQTTY